MDSTIGDFEFLHDLLKKYVEKRRHSELLKQQFTCSEGKTDLLPGALNAVKQLEIMTKEGNGIWNGDDAQSFNALTRDIAKQMSELCSSYADLYGRAFEVYLQKTSEIASQLQEVTDNLGVVDTLLAKYYQDTNRI